MSAARDGGDITVHRRDRVLVVTMNRPSKRNALTGAMYAVMADALSEADGDETLAAVVITGVGDVFTAGNDLKDFAKGESLSEVERFLQELISISVPLIAAVNGTAVGVGLTMLLHCDFVFVEPAAKLFTPFVELGLVPEAASSLLLPRIVGERRASELLMFGRRIDGVEAAEWGLANAAVSPAIGAAMATAGKLAALPAHAVRETKRLLRSRETTIEGRMSEESKAFGRALKGPEFKAAVSGRFGG